MATFDKITLVLGASPNPQRYSYLAVQRLQAHGHPVVAIGNRDGSIGDIKVSMVLPLQGIDTVTLYLNPLRQRQYYDYLLQLHPRRVIFNPGTENDELKRLAEQQGIYTMEACTLVLLSTNQY